MKGGAGIGETYFEADEYLRRVRLCQHHAHIFDSFRTDDNICVSATAARHHDGKHSAKAIKDSVNIRLNPDDSSPILGKLGKNEVIVIVENMGEWYKIEPINESFGWVNKKFVNLAPLRATANKKEEVKLVQKVEKENKITDEKTYLQENVTIEGIIKPYGKVFKRIATHKLITLDNNVFLLKGNKASLDSLNYQKVRITGKSTHPKNQKYTVMEIEKIEAMD